MKSMTDFIMEQEMPSVEEEVFNESEIGRASCRERV